MAGAGIREHFVQDNHSFSVRNVVRGLHYQMHPQGKLVRVAVGEILDVTVLRRSSPVFGRWCGIHLSDATQHMLWTPLDLGMVSTCCRGGACALQGHRFL